MGAWLVERRRKRRRLNVGYVLYRFTVSPLSTHPEGGSVVAAFDLKVPVFFVLFFCSVFFGFVV
jgi:hypothetical protein